MEPNKNVLKKRGKMREFYERVGKHDRSVKVKEEWERVLPVSWTTLEVGSMGRASGEDENWIRVIRLRFSIGQLPLIRGYIAA